MHDVEVEQPRREARQAVCRERRERDRHRERQQAVRHDQRQVDQRDLPVAGPDGLHHPDLAGLLRDDDRDGVGDEEPGHQQAQEPDPAERHEHRGQQLLGGMLPGRRHEREGDRESGPLDPKADLVGDGLDVLAGGVRVVHPDAQLVE